MIGNIKLNRLRPIALENLLAELWKRTWRDRPIQESTVQKYLTVVSAVLSDAKRNEIIGKNPARMIDLPETASRMQMIPTDEEAHRFLDLLAEEEDPYKTFYALAIYTGCSYCYKKMREAQVGGFEMSDYVFTNQNGKQMHSDIFSRYLRRLYDKNNFPKTFHLHTLRHYFVSTMLHSGVDKHTVAELAGHDDTGFLERTYCHPQMQLKRQAAERYTQTMFDFSGRDSERA